jgi:hypothetical protein
VVESSIDGLMGCSKIGLLKLINLKLLVFTLLLISTPHDIVCYFKLQTLKEEEKSI